LRTGTTKTEAKDNAEPQNARSHRRGTPTRVFCQKSVDLLDCKGVEVFDDGPFEAQGKQESARV